MRTIPPFTNEPLTDFSFPASKTAVAAAISELVARSQVQPQESFPIISGQLIKGTGDKAIQYDPSTGIKLGTVSYATAAETQDAINSVATRGVSWSEQTVAERCTVIRRLADLLVQEKVQLTAQLILEVGKPWKDADADVAEAIDFCRYYAQYAEFYGGSLPTSSLPGEANEYVYFPRGITAVISPWNFPLAIACGMTVASLVTGNPTILKPAEQSSLIGFELARLILKAGVPPDSFAFLPGKGEEVGRTLVESPAIVTVCFTGSKDVGLEIIRSSAITLPGQERVKRVIAEMGGKNSTIVDNDADLDDTLKGILYSAFGFAGQKCSACSRIIVVGSAMYERLLARLGEAAQDLIVGSAHNSDSFFGPVIDAATADRIKKVIENAENNYKSVFVGTMPKEPNSAFVPPAVFRDVPETSELWHQEIFGPVVACTMVESFKDAVELANRSEYALTGAVFSRHPDNIEYAKRHFQVGNLYINRGSTGALVGRQPFGGFKMSGVGSKAGGPDYLLQFLEPRTISENTTRRGFTPEMG